MRRANATAPAVSPHFGTEKGPGSEALQLPLVSAIIPAYNCAKTIAAAIESVRAQTWPHIEIVICDDGSTDDTARVIAEVAPDAVYVHQENAGPSAARNTAAAAASGEFLATLDADDYWLPEKTARQMAVLLADETVGAVATNGFQQRDGRQQLWTRTDGPRLREMTVHEQLRGDLRPISASMIIRTELFRTLGGYDTALTCGEDLDLLCRLVASGYRLIYLNEPLYRYVRRSGSITSSHTIRERPEDLLRVVTKLDPRVEHEGYCSPLSVREFACFQGERLLRLAWAEVVAGDRATAQEYLARIGELPGPAVIHRLLHRLSGRTWPVTKLLLAANRRMKAVHHYCRRWGVPAGVGKFLAARGDA